MIIIMQIIRYIISIFIIIYYIRISIIIMI